MRAGCRRILDAVRVNYVIVDAITTAYDTGL